MRCSCHNCGTYMAQSEGLELGCVCPECGNRCKACLGTNTVISREELRGWKNSSMMESIVLDKFQSDEERADAEQAEENWKDDEKWQG